MQVLPEVVDAEYRGGHKIHLTFNDGSEKTLDFRPWLKQGPVFHPLKDEAYFKKFFLDGGTVAWPNGADIAPEVLYGAELVKLPSKRRAGRVRNAGGKVRRTRKSR